MRRTSWPRSASRPATAGPPADPVNAMLSLAYAMLTRHVTVALASAGLDPWRGFCHAPRYGRPALAL